MLALCRHDQAVAITSRLVLLEAERNIRAKLGAEALVRFYRTIAELDLEVVPAPTPQEIAVHSQIIDPKDGHVLAAALKGRAEVLLTLDRKHFLSSSMLQTNLPFEIMTPGDFLRRLAR